MQWLLDANLSYRMVKQLASLPVTVRHVSRTGLPVPADDYQIWEWAKEHDYLVITNDEDFYRLAGTFGFPPKVLMLRTGNQSTRFLAALLTRHLSTIQALADSPEAGVMELF